MDHERDVVLEWTVTVVMSICLCAHLILMIFPSKMWADFSIVLLSLTLYHIYGALHCCLEAWRVKGYLKLTCLRIFNDCLAYFSITGYIFFIIYELYLIYFTTDISSMVMSSFLGYALIMSITGIPQIFVTIMFNFGYNKDKKPPKKIKSSMFYEEVELVREGPASVYHLV
jgi:hypothetical protein